MQLILLQSSCKRAQWKLAFKWPSAVNHLLSRGKDYANERNESLLSNCRVQLIFCKDGKYLRTKQVHNGSQAKKEWREPLLSSLSCKLGSGKTRRKENSKEESTPYDGADSLKQIHVLSTFQFTRFQPTELNSLLVSTRLSCFSAS